MSDPVRPDLKLPDFGEFIAMMALTMSLVALTIDALLPAHGLIGTAYAVADANETQHLVYAVFYGLGISQLAFGPLADAYGRKFSVYLGLAIFTAGTVLCVYAATYDWLLVGRVLQGVGIAGPRAMTAAIVRDLYVGRQMARVMSFILSFFVLVPAIAPAIGQLMLGVFGWRSIFWLYLVIGAIIVAWFVTRMPETLKSEHRQSLSLRSALSNMLEVLATPISLGYMVAATLISAAFIGFLGSSQQIFVDQYGLGDLFPLFFAGLALSVGISTTINGRIVVRVGMRPLAMRAALGYTASGALLFVLALANDGSPPIWLTMICLCLVFLFVGFLFGNLNALAMEPLGHIAGTAAAVIGSVVTLAAGVIGAVTGSFYDGTMVPLGGALVVLGGLAILTLWATGRISTNPPEGELGDVEPAPSE
ncbi:MAG: multidrug effflux MFS transporter [Pseudomonadota bacterium]